MGRRVWTDGFCDSQWANAAMTHPVRLCLVLHNHQPIGNFDGVIEQAYRDSYLPFLDIFEDFPSLKISLHTSGPLLKWLVEHQPGYVRRVQALVANGRIEILGGPMYEPILTMLPSRDRIGQIMAYSDYLTDLFSTTIDGMWMPERVWESGLTTDIARAGISYTVLDDFHFKAAGWSDEELTGSFLTEDDGHVIRVFPGSERLRYLIPFAEPNETLAYARNIADLFPNAVLVFGDDGEKFGTWPDTQAHVYERGWLRRFFNALVENGEWLQTATLREAVTDLSPVGKIYLPDCSYREMTEWALPASQQEACDELAHDMADHPRWPELARFIRGGNWRNFKVRYEEANEMYARMLQVSRNLQLARQSSGDADLLAEAQDHLYRGQCNCPYWHGAFGGIYLPHLRHANYRELIAADNLLETLERGNGQWVEATSDDYNLDQRTEVRLASDQFAAYVAPARGGMLYELDVRCARQNLLAGIQRRPEAYHRKVRRGSTGSTSDVASIHDRVVFKQAGLEQRLQYDVFPRKSFLEHFYDNDAGLGQVATGTAMERGDFVAEPFEAKLRRAANKVQLLLTREGNAWGLPLRMTKALTMESGSPLLQLAYLIEGLPRDRQLHLALEWNFAGLPAGADDRYFYSSDGSSLGQLGTNLDLEQCQHLGLIDCWAGLDVLISLNRPSNIWAFPLETVSQSEGGFELVHQSVCVMPHWLICGDAEGKWSLQMQVRIAPGHQPCVLAERSVRQTILAQ
jgi:4-alpha-glucanotransferase